VADALTIPTVQYHDWNDGRDAHETTRFARLDAHWDLNCQNLYLTLTRDAKKRKSLTIELGRTPDARRLYELLKPHFEED
jgi:hypothetical protein